MKQLSFFLFLLSLEAPAWCQSTDELSVEKIMRDPVWIGTAPSGISWSLDSKSVYFNWNPDKNPADSLYSISISNHTPRKVNPKELQAIPGKAIQYNRSYTRATYEKDGDIFLYDIPTRKTIQITRTATQELTPYFSFDEEKVFFTSSQNTFSWEIGTGALEQLTDFRAGTDKQDVLSDQDKWLKQDQLEFFSVLNERNKKQALKEKNEKFQRPKPPKPIFIGEGIVDMVQVSPDEKFITYRMTRPSKYKPTIVPNYVTETGFTTDIPSRPKVGSVLAERKLFVYDTSSDSVLEVKLDMIPGITDSPEYVHHSPSTSVAGGKLRNVNFSAVSWSDNGKYCAVAISALDFKDRWIMLLDASTQKLSLLHREHDDAWVGSPMGTGFSNEHFGWLDEKHIWFVSEASGFAHLYQMDIYSKETKALTSGKFEIQQVVLSRSKKFFYIVTNEVHPGEKHVYRLSSSGGKPERLTTMTGSNEMTLSPDESTIALRYSYSNKPWELYLMENRPGATPVQITRSLTTEFLAYPWRDPEVVTFRARDEAQVYARIYKPKQPNGAAILFVHGAGYLQNAHKWWSSYFREYMFHNLLADHGYTVMDIDYRASAGYGRNWRTAIYRHMGGKDLEDNLDGAKFLVDQFNIDPKRIGIYGGSYGGFITLMAMFTAPDVFACGAALRPVTDWAHYNPTYTGSILNIPYLDSAAYASSSPLYYAEGLKGALLICHGMVDTNVHFQDAVRLSQRLIELGKDNWELAVYPMESHGFVESSSWTDEYKRILKLFDENLLSK